MFILATYTADSGIFVTAHQSEEEALISCAEEVASYQPDEEAPIPHVSAIVDFINCFNIDYQFTITKV